MSTNSYLIKVGVVEAMIVRKPVKNLHLAVLPPAGKVRVTAPLSMKEDAIRTLVATKIGWIKKQQAKFAGQARQTRREYISGESHYFLGKRYRLEVVTEQARPTVSLKANGRMILSVRPGSSRAKREEVLIEWYRAELREIVTELLSKWQNKIGVQLDTWRIMRMKTRWGTCNHKAGRITLNLELAKKPLSCIEYVTVHELVHLIEKKHNERFQKLMTKYLPKWRSAKEELNRFILAHEEWEY
ncbi:MAG: metal-dependent hydrolase [candidate division Zixibacteria bacterium RBG_16_53_22]|nr:MAG: metal-dependent hydrolase [candidate division Zixibacteria bacterium RBG_16_53_22]